MNIGLFVTAIDIFLLQSMITGVAICGGDYNETSNAHGDMFFGAAWLCGP